ncbi:MAG: ABC transporter transmembrane domain-containing protein [Eubacteriales bacterium]
MAKEVIAVYPNFENSGNINKYALLAVIWACATMAIYLTGLLMAHVSAFRIAKNLRKAALEHTMKLPLGYFTAAGSGRLRQLIDECAASTETYLAHNIPDLASAFISPIAIPLSRHLTKLFILFVH